LTIPKRLGINIGMENTIAANRAVGMSEHIENLSAWKCFHCGMVLRTEHEAREHFGPAAGAGSVCAVLGLGPDGVQRLIAAESSLQQVLAALKSLTVWLEGKTVEGDSINSLARKLGDAACAIAKAEDCAIRKSWV
jgi:hypothetical protein